MKYIPKNTYISDKIKLLLIVLIFFVIGVHLISPQSTAGAVGFSVLVLMICRAFVFPRKWEKSIGELVKKASLEDIAHFAHLVSKYLPVLARKKKFLIVKDDYGYTIRDKWESEKKSFLRKFNYIPMSTEYYPGLDIDQQDSLIDALVNDYSQDNNVSTSYTEDMRPSEYEYYCSELLNDNGWQAKTTKATGDQGVDVLAERTGLKVAIQCKKYSNPVGNKAVQEVAAGKNYWDADIAVVVTNSTYTPSARTLATSLGVFLLHHEQLPYLLDIIEGALEVEN